MGTVDRIKERLENKELIGKACPICGSAPKMISVDLGRPGGHGYPGCVNIHLECSGCRIIKGGTYDTIGHKLNKVKNLAIKDWNEVVDYINNLIEQRNKKGN